MKSVVLLALLGVALQDPLVDQEKERIRSKAPLTEAERKAYEFPAAPAAKPLEGYSLAVIPLGFSDHAVGAGDPEKLLFRDVRAYYAKASAGRFKLWGKVFGAVTLDVERAKFKDADLPRAARALEAREGKELLAGFDGVAFVAAGPLGARGTPLWPHKESFPWGDRKLDYVLLAEEAGDRAVGIAAHEVMHLFGLADKYDDEKALVGKWCILGTGYSAREPAPPCADCRSKLGWTAAAPLDPRASARVVMDADPARALRIPLNPDGSEALLLELRDRLFVWHTGGGKTIELLGRYPAEAADRLTPYSEPPFRARAVGSWDAWITDVRLEGGKAWFRVGPGAPLTAPEEARKARVGKRLGDRP
jgi:M6 family metalloprotease-like protein